jgi:hypothetical protein
MTCVDKYSALLIATEKEKAFYVCSIYIYIYIYIIYISLFSDSVCTEIQRRVHLV